MIKWGILGLGNMGSRFAEAIKEVDNAQLNGLASSNQNRLNKFSEKYKITKEKCFNNYDELINSDLVDAIYISTLNNTHSDLITKCSKAKKHILCEKPAGLNLEEIKNVDKHIKKNNIIFFEAIAYYSHPQKEQIKNLLKKNEIGKIIKIESSFGFKARLNPSSRLFNKKLGGGAILDVGCYPISFLMLFSNNESDFIFKNKKILLSKTDVDNFAEANLIISKDIEANIKVSLSENLSNDCLITGSTGKIKISSPWIPSTKSYLEILSKKHFYKQFIKSEKTIYAHQIEKVSKAIEKKLPQNENLFDIEKSLICSSLLDKWRN